MNYHQAVAELSEVEIMPTMPADPSKSQKVTDAAVGLTCSLLSPLGGLP